MPQLKKSFVSSNNILPKVDMKFNQYTEYDSESLVSPSSYLALLIEDGQSLTSEPESDVSDSVQNRPRKRQRLDHLSQEEKILRRKLKNRVAAQTARDRKKAKMQELEDQVAILTTEKRILSLKTVEHLNKIRALETENSELKKRLGLNFPQNLQKVELESDYVSKEEESPAVSDETRSFEQASLINVAQLKVQDLQTLSLWMMRFIYLPVIASLMTFWICSNSVGIWNMTSVTPRLTVKQNSNLHSLLKWWGPHQKAWNPTKN